MSYLKFERATMTNLQAVMGKELLRANRSGAYSCSTLVDCNTRKYHGLLVVPVPEIDEDNHVLLSSLDCSVVQHGVEFNLGLHKYQGDSYSPNGHKYIREFECDTVPTTLYRVGGVILKKELLFQHFEDRILLRYTLVDGPSDTILRFRPFLAFRSVNDLAQENGVASREYQEVSGGIKTSMYAGYPDLYMQFSKKNEFIFQPDWYRGLEYPKEQERGYAFKEDLYVPGYFEMNIKKGESIVFAGSTSKATPSALKKLFDEEVNFRLPRDNFYHALIASAHQFFIHKKSGDYVLAGYPWFHCRARDMFISLPGLTLAIEEIDKFELIMKTAGKALNDFLIGKPIQSDIAEIEQPDVPLWAAWAIQQYARTVGREKCYEMYGDLLINIVKTIESGKHPNIHEAENGLLIIDGTERAMTWMNSTVYGRPVVPRTGYVVEINALWYNALKFVANMAEKRNDKKIMDAMEARAAKVKDAFQKTFVNEHGYLWDYVDQWGNANFEVRPNMIFAVALEYSPLEPAQQKSVLDFCTRELQTPKGLRSLSPKSGAYNPSYLGTQNQRDWSYHQGTAWPWLGCFYMEAVLKVFKRSRLSFVHRQMVGFEDEMFYHAIGTMPELFEGNPPFHGRGGSSFAMNVAALLRMSKLLESYTY